jgi:probable poly-beta-1,6-N-acetyl-D-glucosamine export protein
MAIQENRDNAFDTFRGLAIIAVIATHAIYFGGSPHNSGFVYYRQLLNFCVPAFFFISGYWASRKQIMHLAEYKAFLWRRLSRILLPYLFWSFVVIGYSIVKTRHFDGSKTLFVLLTGGACMGYYFIIAITQLYFLTPILQYLNRKLGVYAVALILVVNMTGFLVLYLSRLFNVIPHLPAAMLFYSWIIYYEFGLFAGENEMAVHTRKTRLFRPFVLYALLVSLLISMVETTAILSEFKNPAFAVFPTTYSSLLYSTCVIIGFLFYREYFEWFPRLFGEIGRYSFGIYLIHIFVLGEVVWIFSRFNLLYSFQPLHQFVLVVTTLSICLVLIAAARRVLPKLIYSKILGF